MQLLQELGLPELQSSEWSFFGESTDIGRICSLALILLGLIGLRTFSGTARCGRKRIAQSLAQTPVCYWYTPNRWLPLSISASCAGFRFSGA